jgi:hypothetical protein
MINHYVTCTIGQLVFNENNIKSGNLVAAGFKDSLWSKTDNINDKTNDNNFFAVHYEMNKQDPNKVMFHVESPPKNINPDLNLIKRFLILSITADILSVTSQIKTNLTQFAKSGVKSDYKIKVGRKNDSYDNNSINHNPTDIETHNSTTVFTIQFTQPIIPGLTHNSDLFKISNDEQLDFELKIKELHRNLAHVIDKFLFPFIPLLNNH